MRSTLLKINKKCFQKPASLGYFLLELPRLLVFLHVLLALQFRRGVEHDVLDLVLDVLRPRSEPRDSVVVLYFFPPVI